MPDVIDWNDAGGNGQRSKDGIRNLRLKSGNRYEFRFVGHPIKFNKYFENGKYAIVRDARDNPVARMTGKEAGPRYAANVLLREATTSSNSAPLPDHTPGLVYLMEFAQSVYNDVRDWGSARKTDPGGKSGCNFSVTVTGQQKNTRYKTVGLDITPFTDAEKEYLRANIYDLTKLFKETPDEELLEKLGYKLDGGKQAAAPDEAPSEVAGGVELPF
jgi:hypothetical protein